MAYLTKRREWLRRYIPAEAIGTITALIGAWSTFSHTHSFIAATAAGWVGEGIGFYGYFIITELNISHRGHAGLPFYKRAIAALRTGSTNLIIEFMPAEVIDNFFIRPLTMYEAPQLIHPYPIGFLVGKFSADIFFYVLAIIGYEARKKWRN
ncbi:MAG TPA: hypothetical protein VFN51_01760 [Candidatus Saccharimonadales bacterium]|nr:hypothetical protein [Candidatus Saccharimonadales bacterium]